MNMSFGDGGSGLTGERVATLMMVEQVGFQMLLDWLQGQELQRNKRQSLEVNEKEDNKSRRKPEQKRKYK